MYIMYIIQAWTFSILNTANSIYIICTYALLIVYIHRLEGLDKKTVGRPYRVYFHNMYILDA